MLWLTPDDFVPWKHRRRVARSHNFDAVWAMAGDGLEIMDHLDGPGPDTLPSGLSVQALVLHMAWMDMDMASICREAPKGCEEGRGVRDGHGDGCTPFSGCSTHWQREFMVCKMPLSRLGHGWWLAA